MKFIRRNLGELLSLLMVAIAIYLSSRAMFHEGFFRTIDDVTTVRISHMARELSRGFWSGNFPVRLGGELAYRYGYFFYLFYAPLVYYAGALIMLVGHLSDIMATKAVYAFPLIVGPILFYWASRQKLGKFPTVIASIFFALFPYRGFDTYFRGGVGENWAITFIPGLFAGIFLCEKKSRFGPLITALFLALIIISHNITGLMIIPLAILYGLIFLRHHRAYWLSLILGAGISSFFWIPMGTYLPLISANSTSLNTIYLMSTLLPFWEIIKPSLTYLPGATFVPAFFYLLILGTLVFIKYRGSLKVAGLFWFLISLILYLSLSQPFAFLWQLTLPLTRTLQFSWRVLILLSFSLPMAAAYLIASINSKLVQFALASMIVILSLSFTSSFAPKEYSYFYSYSADDSSHCGTTTFEEYFPTWVVQCVNQAQAKELFLTSPGELTILQNQVINITANYFSETDNTLMINKYYFPGWHVTVDEVDMTINYRSTISGIMVVTVPRGSHQVHIYYAKTPLMKLADLISLSAITVWLICLTVALRQRRIK